MYMIDYDVSFIEKNNIYAVYAKHNLFFFKDKVSKYFSYVINESFDLVPRSFISYLLNNGILVKGNKNDKWIYPK